MTFILVAAGPRFLVQVSDRRISTRDSVVSDDANKAGVFRCADARVVYGYCGLASAPGFQTDLWLMKQLLACAPPDFIMGRIGTRLLDAATRTFKTHPGIRSLPAEMRRMTVMLSGYLY